MSNATRLTLFDMDDRSNMIEAVWLGNIKKDIKMARAEKCYFNQWFKVIAISSLKLSHTDGRYERLFWPEVLRSLFTVSGRRIDLNSYGAIDKPKISCFASITIRLQFLPTLTKQAHRCPQKFIAIRSPCLPFGRTSGCVAGRIPSVSEWPLGRF